MIDIALRRLAEMRLPDGAFLYSQDHKYSPRHPANRRRGSIGRTQSGHYALWLWSASKMDEAKVREGLDAFFEEHNFIQMGRKRPYPHESWYATAAYYYYFGHYYAARLLEKMGPDGKAAYGKSCRTSSCRIRNRTARGGTTQCGTITSLTGPPTRS